MVRRRPHTQSIPLAHCDVVARLPDGGPARVVPRMVITVDGLPCAAGEVIECDPTGRVSAAVVAHDIVVMGVPVRGGTKLAFRASYGGPGDQPVATLAREYTHAGVTYRAGEVFDAVERAGVLAAPYTARGITLAPGTRIGFDLDFDFAYAKLAVDHDVLGVVFPAGTELEIFPRRFDLLSLVGGLLRTLRNERAVACSAVLAAPQVVGGVAFAAGARVWLDTAGPLRR